MTQALSSIIEVSVALVVGSRGSDLKFSNTKRDIYIYMYIYVYI